MRPLTLLVLAGLLAPSASQAVELAKDRLEERTIRVTGIADVEVEPSATGSSAEDAERKARRYAVRAAKNKAADLALELGQEVGRPIEVEVDTRWDSGNCRAAAMAFSVSVVFELVDPGE